MAQKNVEHFVGTDVLFNVTTVVPDGDDITNWTLQFRIVDSAGVVLVEKTSTSGIGVTGLTSYQVDLTDGTSYGLVAGSYKYGIRIVDQPQRALDVYGTWKVKDWPA